MFTINNILCTSMHNRNTTSNQNGWYLVINNTSLNDFIDKRDIYSSLMLLFTRTTLIQQTLVQGNTTGPAIWWQPVEHTGMWIPVLEKWWITRGLAMLMYSRSFHARAVYCIFSQFVFELFSAPAVISTHLQRVLTHARYNCNEWIRRNEVTGRWRWRHDGRVP